jgi:heme exporter protein D
MMIAYAVLTVITIVLLVVENVLLTRAIKLRFEEKFIKHEEELKKTKEKKE